MDQLIESCKIPANPDISGIGVRVSIYAQAALTSIAILVAFVDGRLSKKELETLRGIHSNLLVSSFALLASAIVQLGVKKLSVFHTILVLHLCLINCISVSSMLLMEFFTNDTGQTIMSRSSAIRKHHSFIERTRELALACLHAAFCSALGLYTWAKLPILIAKQPCSTTTLFSLAGHPISLHSQKLRIISLIWYSIFSVPGFNLAFLCIISVLLSCVFCAGVLLPSVLAGVLAGWDFETDRVIDVIFLIMPFLGCFVTQVILVVDVEVMVQRNRPFIGDGEGEWSFGQTLALFLLISPSMVTAKVIIMQFTDRKEWEEKKDEKGEDSKPLVEPEVKADSETNKEGEESKGLVKREDGDDSENHDIGRRKNGDSMNQLV